VTERVTLDDFNDTEDAGYGHWPFSENGQPTDAEDSWAPINLATLPDQPPTQPTLGQVGIVYPGKRHVFSGPQESAKTLAAYAIGLEVIRHEGGTLILIDFEMGAWDTRTRLRELGATDPELSHVQYIEPSEPATDCTMPRLLELDPQLVIVDAAAGAYDLQGLDDNKRQDVERFTRLYVKAFWRAGVATIVLDHVVKNTENRGRYTIGSERKVGGADVHLGFDVITPISRGHHGLYKISTHKDRGGFLKRGTLANFDLSSDPDTHQITWAFKAAAELEAGDDFRPTTLMERVSQYLETMPEGASRNQIETDVKGKAAYLRKATEALVQDGYATETNGPRNALIYTTCEPYRTPETDLVPTSSPPRPDEVRTTSSHTTPPYGGGTRSDQLEDEEKTPTSSRTRSTLQPELDHDSDIPF
jgi:hypothetical protein